MKFFPSEHIIFKTKLSPNEVINRIQSNTAKPRKGLEFRDRKSKKSYVGLVYNDSFNIVRDIDYQNSFMPLIKGNVKQNRDDTEIEIKMGLDRTIKFILPLCLTIGPILSLIFVFNQKLVSTEYVIGIIGIPILFYLFAIGIFKYESNLSKKHLTQLLEVNE